MSSMNLENDELTCALRRKEHPGRTRGTGLVPWAVSFEQDKGTYRSRSRKRAEQESEWQEILDTMRAELTEHSDKLRAEFEEKLSRLPVAQDQAAPPFTSPTGIRSSCGSTVLPEEEQLGTYPVDEITHPTPCKLYVQDKIFKNKVATGQAWPGNDVIMHGNGLPLGYAKRVELRTSELLLSDIVSLQEELAGFIVDHVANQDAEFCVI